MFVLQYVIYLQEDIDKEEVTVGDGGVWRWCSGRDLAIIGDDSGGCRGLRIFGYWDNVYLLVGSGSFKDISTYGFVGGIV